MSENSVNSENITRLEKRSKMEFFSKLHSRMEIAVTERKGYENLLAVPRDKPVVIAPDHLSDITMETVIAEASPYRKVGTASQSTHLEIPLYGKFMEWAGSRRVYPISTNEETKHQRQAQHIYRLSDYEVMADAMMRGESIVTAAHRPEYSGHLPNHSGLSALTLAHLTESPVIPAAVDIHASPEVIKSLVKDLKGSVKRFVTGKKPNTTVLFGEPIEFEHISREDLQLLERFINLPLRRTLSDEEKDKANAVYQKITKQGEILMQAVANLLPPEKRGKWVENSENK